MIKRTLYFGNPAYLSTHLDQVVVKLPDTDEKKTIPIEDTGIVIIDHQQITISQALIAKLLANNIAIITCNSTHHPTGLMLNLDEHTLQSQKFQAQIEASKPLLKQMWQQTIMAKIENQANLLASMSKIHFETFSQHDNPYNVLVPCCIRRMSKIHFETFSQHW